MLRVSVGVAGIDQRERPDDPSPKRRNNQEKQQKEDWSRK